MKYDDIMRLYGTHTSWLIGRLSDNLPNVIADLKEKADTLENKVTFEKIDTLSIEEYKAITEKIEDIYNSIDTFESLRTALADAEDDIAYNDYDI